LLQNPVNLLIDRDRHIEATGVRITVELHTDMQPVAKYR